MNMSVVDELILNLGKICKIFTYKGKRDVLNLTRMRKQTSTTCLKKDQGFISFIYPF